MPILELFAQNDPHLCQRVLELERDRNTLLYAANYYIYTTMNNLPEANMVAQSFSWLINHCSAEINTPDKDGRTALITILDGLYEKLAQQAAKSVLDETMAIQIARPFIKIIQQLIQAGADPSLKDNSGANAWNASQLLRRFLPAQTSQQLYLILSKRSHLLQLPWRAVPHIKRQLAAELSEISADTVVARAALESGVAEAKADTSALMATGSAIAEAADAPAERPESVMGFNALAIAVADLEAAEGNDSGDGGENSTAERAGSAQTAPFEFNEDEAQATMPSNPPLLSRL